MNLTQVANRISQLFNTGLDYLNPHYLNARSTAKTSLGFMGTFIERWLPASLRSTTLESIFNYLPLTDNIATAGQPTEAQLKAIKEAGFINVINLAPHGLENSLQNEQGVVTALGLHYTHIPVDFKNPTEEDFAKFCAEMRQLATQKTLVHCAANMRVSAFMYRYRTQVLGMDKLLAQQDLDKIWQPFDVWAEFIKRPFLVAQG